MKIGFLISYFYPQSGGAENNCYYTAKELAKKHEVHVFCSGKENSDELIDGIHIHRSKEIFRIKYYLAFYPKIVKKLQEYNLDVLHVHGLGFVQHDIAINKLKKKNPKIKIVCTPHGPFMALRKYNLLASSLKNSYMPFLKKGIKRYDKIIEVNPYQEIWMNKEYGIPKKKIVLVPNGVSLDVFSKIDEKYKSSLKKIYGLNGKIVITYLGRIQEYKGIDQIIKALSYIEDKNFVFLAIGKDSGDKERLISLAKKRGVEKQIIFTGEVSEKEKLALLEISEIFVLPSEWEAFGIAMLEAMAKGNAIISSDTEGGKYLIGKNNGFIFEYGNEKELYDKLRILIKNPKLRNKIQKSNIKKSKEFLWKDISNKLEGIYKKL